jgi:hypothetical protein
LVILETRNDLRSIAAEEGIARIAEYRPFFKLP